MENAVGKAIRDKQAAKKVCGMIRFCAGPCRKP